MGVGTVIDPRTGNVFLTVQDASAKAHRSFNRGFYVGFGVGLILAVLIF